MSQTAAGPIPREADDAGIKQAVRDRYTRAAGGACCGDAPAVACCASAVTDDLAREVPSLGCGSPVEAADLQPGETVVDLGSGRGLDVFRAAQRVGPSGRVIGIDMTPEMVRRAGDDAGRLGLRTVEFHLAEIEALPLPAASVDVVVSNCVINLVPDKDRVFAEAFRVLRPGGRLIVADIVRARPRTGPASLDRWAACLDGAEEERIYLGRIRRAGFAEPNLLSREGTLTPRRLARRALGGGDLYSITVRAFKR